MSLATPLAFEFCLKSSVYECGYAIVRRGMIPIHICVYWLLLWNERGGGKQMPTGPTEDSWVAFYIDVLYTGSFARLSIYIESMRVCGFRKIIISLYIIRARAFFVVGFSNASLCVCVMRRRVYNEISGVDS